MQSARRDRQSLLPTELRSPTFVPSKYTHFFFLKKGKKNEKKIANISLDSRNESVDYYSEKDENLTSSGLSLCTHFFLIHVHPFLSFPA